MRTPGAIAFFCLASGALLGLLFLAGEAIAGLLGLKKPGRAVVDLLCCGVAGVTVFLCALAVDSGRLRLFQVALQALGGWAAWAALSPWARRTAHLGAAWRRRFRAKRGPKSQKRSKKPKKEEKKT